MHANNREELEEDILPMVYLALESNMSQVIKTNYGSTSSLVCSQSWWLFFTRFKWQQCLWFPPSWTSYLTRWSCLEHYNLKRYEYLCFGWGVYEHSIILNTSGSQLWSVMWVMIFSGQHQFPDKNSGSNKNKTFHLFCKNTTRSWCKTLFEKHIRNEVSLKTVFNVTLTPMIIKN